jgi:enamine deaminase RidA (YjgF/YER057c/UK114 family)
MSTINKLMKEKSIRLPKRNLKGKGLLPLRQEGDLVFMSGHGCEDENGEPIHRGKVGADLTVEQGYEAARQCGLQLLASLELHLGSLDRVKEIVKVLGFVSSSSDFYRQPEVMHGFSDLMVEIFGERGKHARSAIGTNVLPDNQAVEIEMIVRIRD